MVALALALAPTPTPNPNLPLPLPLTLPLTLTLTRWQHERDKQGRPFIFTVENPRATIEAHPLTRKCLLLPRAAGGLGGKARHFTNCWFPRSAEKVHRKPGVLISNNKTLLDDFADGKYMCRKGSQCPRRAAGRKHDKLEGASCTAAGGFSPELADHLARMTAREESRLDGQADGQACRAAACWSYPATVSPREILREAAKAADKGEKLAAPPSASFAAGHRTYEQRLLDFGLESIADSPPASAGAATEPSSSALVVMPQQASEDCSNDVASEAGEEEEEEEEEEEDSGVDETACLPASMPPPKPRRPTKKASPMSKKVSLQPPKAGPARFTTTIIGGKEYTVTFPNGAKRSTTAFSTFGQKPRRRRFSGRSWTSATSTTRKTSLIAFPS